MSELQQRPRPEWLTDPNIVVFAGESELAVGAFQPEALGGWIGNLFGRTKDAVKEDWDRVLAQMGFFLENVALLTDKFELSEITFELGFSAEGQVVFVAKAGIQTTITAKFTRKAPAN